MIWGNPARIDSATGTAAQPSSRVLIVRGTYRVLEFAVCAKVKRFLLISSRAVYGKQPKDVERVPETYLGAPFSVRGPDEGRLTQSTPRPTNWAIPRKTVNRFLLETNDAVHLSGPRARRKLRRIIELTEQWQSQ